MMKKLPFIFGIFLIAVIMFTAGPACSDLMPDEVTLIQITTDEQLARYLENQTARYNLYDKNYEDAIIDRDFVMEMAAAPTGLMKSAPAVSLASSQSDSTGFAGSHSAGTHTTTNIQVTGVDEADFVKNDGKYIYIISGNTLSIVQAYPPQSALVLSQTEISGSVSDIFYANDRLVVFTSRYGYIQSMKSAEAFRPPSGERTSALIYDISNRSKPELIREISAPGNYQNARMIGDYIYFLTAENEGFYNLKMPVIYDKMREIPVNSVWCPPGIGYSLRMNTLTSFPISGSGNPEAESFLLGWDTTLYVSPTDVYVAYEKNLNWWNRPLFNEINPDSPVSSSRQESIIHRLSINQGLINYKATGIVPGYLLNQFSLDQYDGNLRVATTRQDNSQAGQSSGVYVLNSDLSIIGMVENLAPGEKIYSARFMDDLLYLVTFKQTDPLFVIDLSNPLKPGILGELKIPGYSDYLHPFDKTHLIGIGKDTEENSWGGVIPTGVKLALFDVSNLNNPQLIDSRVIGKKGSDSAVLSDHRAFLLDKSKNIMVLPIKEVVHTPVIGSKYDGSYTQDIWQGAYVFGIDPLNGFVEIGKISQGIRSDDEYWWSGSTVLRSIFMDSVLYTISKTTIIGTDIKDLSARLMNIELTSSSIPWYLQPFASVIRE
jgi:uncharacterized secreted protein with C-terminal beta-propeller domain